MRKGQKANKTPKIGGAAFSINSLYRSREWEAWKCYYTNLILYTSRQAAATRKLLNESARARTLYCYLRKYSYLENTQSLQLLHWILYFGLCVCFLLDPSWRERRTKQTDYTVWWFIIVEFYRAISLSHKTDVRKCSISKLNRLFDGVR